MAQVEDARQSSERLLGVLEVAHINDLQKLLEGSYERPHLSSKHAHYVLKAQPCISINLLLPNK